MSHFGSPDLKTDGGSLLESCAGNQVSHFRSLDLKTDGGSLIESCTGHQVSHFGSLDLKTDGGSLNGSCTGNQVSRFGSLDLRTKVKSREMCVNPDMLLNQQKYLQITRTIFDITRTKVVNSSEPKF